MIETPWRQSLMFNVFSTFPNSHFILSHQPLSNFVHLLVTSLLIVLLLSPISSYCLRNFEISQTKLTRKFLYLSLIAIFKTTNCSRGKNGTSHLGNCRFAVRTLSEEGPHECDALKRLAQSHLISHDAAVITERNSWLWYLDGKFPTSRYSFHWRSCTWTWRLLPDEDAALCPGKDPPQRAPENMNSRWKWNLTWQKCIFRS